MLAITEIRPQKNNSMSSKSHESGKSRPTGSSMLSDIAWRAITESLGFSRRHMQILQGVFDDDKESVIAENLGISPHTVHTHLERIYRKLGVRGRLELVQLILAEFLRLIADVTSGVPPICGYWASKQCPLHGSFGVIPPDGVSPG